MTALTNCNEITAAIEASHLGYDSEVNADGSITLTLPLGYVVTWGVTPWGAVTCNARRNGRRATMRHIKTVQDAETLAMSIAAELRRAA